MLAIAGTDNDFRNSGRNGRTALPCEGLLIHMWMQQDTGSVNRAILADDFPLVCVMIPAGVSVFHGDAESEILAAASDGHINNISFTGPGR